MCVVYLKLPSNASGGIIYSEGGVCIFQKPTNTQTLTEEG